ncbi:phosphatase PAP2 family protein [Nocardioides sp. GY 10127]|uniref:phosphatase PAP2 family protein n=1 Tax=Nocardioides sp. GY 10127 TaxID=2569762 RepID=UPI0010A926FE|nr:phosphatase PAP2 family protein [Nocardioides sp. GY 10127]TIC79413.1 phosphatase PAP2 family protein [Nocardioides sp. GY 10127]
MSPLVRHRLVRLAWSALYALVVAVPVGVLAYLVHTSFPPLVDADQRVEVAATTVTLAHPWLRHTLLVWQTISQPLVAYAVVGLPLCVAVGRRPARRSRAWWAAATMTVGWVLGVSLKEVVRRARPVLDDPVSQFGSYSFPSGHALNAAVLGTTCVLLLWPLLARRGRIVAVALAVAWTAVTCADRILLGAHFPSDVAAGVVLGTGVVLASHAGYRGWTPSMPERDADASTDTATDTHLRSPVHDRAEESAR